MRYPAARILLAASTSTLALILSAPAHAQAQANDRRIEELSKEVDELKAMVRQLQKQVAKKPAVTTAQATPDKPSTGQAIAAAPALPPQTSVAAAPNTMPAAPVAAPAPAPVAVQTSNAPPPAEASAPQSKSIVADLLRGVTINGLLDTYYEFNTNSPIGRINYLRAYDVSSNNFSLNQADLVIESAPDPANGKPFGLRFDLQYGQATATLQGNPANELRPDVYRPVYQAYGTYVVPVGNGITVDFGKWASSLGLEGNYTKDQLNYSRSYWFDYLPFYHTGLRAKYPLNDYVSFNLWITNGTQQTEAFNNYKDQLYGVVITPNPQVSWTINYYRGQEHPDVTYLQTEPAGVTNLPQQQGTFVQPIVNPPTGLLNIGDTYATWQATPALTLGAEADYVSQRLFTTSTADHVYGGALYAGYQITPKLSLAVRGEYLADRGGLFSGTTENLKEATLTLGYRPAGDGFLLDLEYRRDMSNKPYFLTSTLGVLANSQPTIGFGAVWWFGQKQGSW